MDPENLQKPLHRGPVGLAQTDPPLTERELKLKESELEIRERELHLRDQQSQQALWRNPVLLGIIAALIGFMTSVGTTFFQARSNAEIERQRSQSNLIVEAIKTGDPTKAATNLNFFVTLGFLDDPEGRIKAALRQQSSTPVLPAGVLQRRPGPVIGSMRVKTDRTGSATLIIDGLGLDLGARFFIDDTDVVSARATVVALSPPDAANLYDHLKITIPGNGALVKGSHKVNIVNPDGQSAWGIFTY